jgi:hypothetical protein
MLPFEIDLRTKIIFGVNAFFDIHKKVQDFGKKALIVTSQSFSNKGVRGFLTEELTKNLKAAKIESLCFSEIEPNPRAKTIDKAAQIAREEKIDFIIALGGGSCLDSAKLIAMLSINDGSILDYSVLHNPNKRKKFNTALPIVCIPTTAATGSEVNEYAVITDDEKKLKFVLFGKPLKPKLAIVDPSLTLSLTIEQTIDGAFDIITHVIEDYLTNDLNNDSLLQDNLTEAIIKTVITVLPKILDNPNDINARSNLSYASTIALSGLLNGRNSYFPIHALEHALSAYTDAPHGAGLRLFLPRVMAFNSKLISEKICKFNEKIFNIPKTSDPLKALELGLNSYMKNIGAWVHLSDFLKTENLTLNQLKQKIIEHVFLVDGSKDSHEKDFLENIIPIYEKDLNFILNLCEKTTF